MAHCNKDRQFCESLTVEYREASRKTPRGWVDKDTNEFVTESLVEIVKRSCSQWILDEIVSIERTPEFGVRALILVDKKNHKEVVDLLQI